MEIVPKPLGANMEKKIANKVKDSQTLKIESRERVGKELRDN